jgi:hypothetical protein
MWRDRRYSALERAVSPGWIKRRRPASSRAYGGPAGKPAIPVTAMALPRRTSNQLTVLHDDYQRNAAELGILGSASRHRTRITRAKEHPGGSCGKRRGEPRTLPTPPAVSDRLELRSLVAAVEITPESVSGNRAFRSASSHEAARMFVRCEICPSTLDPRLFGEY